MLMFEIPFGTTTWDEVERTEHAGETGKAYWQEPMRPGETHKDVNDTNATIELLVVEIK